ncbi:MAG: hypothetical protein ABSF98_10925 [Bryobacteraceae bacterium]|jgi:hypothetical protein
MADSEKWGGELNSWKEIASFLGVNVRTAQRWEGERGLPVRRFPGDKGRVAADVNQLLAWQEKPLHGRLPWWRDLRLVQRYALAATGLALALAAALIQNVVRARTTGIPAAGRFEFRTLIVNDAAGHELWRRNFPDPFLPDAYWSAASGRTLWFGDIDGDGSIETVFAYHPAARGRTGTTLLCFGADGREKWHFTAGRPVSDEVETYDGVYSGTDFVVADFGPRFGRMAVITSHHLTGHPNQVAAIDGHGRVRGEYWHSGHLDSVAVSDVPKDAVPEVLLTGVDNARQAATLVVLNAGRISGASDAAGTKLQLRGFEKAREEAVLWFPRTCVNRLTELYNVARNVRPHGPGYDVYVQEKPDDPGAAVIYTLAQDLTLVHWKMSDRLQALHAALRREGKLDHDLDPDGADALRIMIRR